MRRALRAPVRLTARLIIADTSTVGAAVAEASQGSEEAGRWAVWSSSPAQGSRLLSPGCMCYGARLSCQECSFPVYSHCCGEI